MHARPATRHSEPGTGGHADSMAKSRASSMLLNIRRCRTRLNTDVLAHNPEAAGSNPAPATKFAGQRPLPIPGGAFLLAL
jgi:hypothetical protein